MKVRQWVLPIIVFSQFCCTSLWFAENGVMQELAQVYHLDNSAVGHITSAVQFGFIAGTLIFALYTISDRFSPSKVFFFSALAGALFNLAVIVESNTFASILLLRFFTGFFLAGIYPVGMKIAADYFQKGLGKSLGYLVGALVLGTAFPHLIKAFTLDLPWRYVLIITSVLAVIGGLLILLLVPNGPYRTQSQKIDLSAFYKVFANKGFRAAAFGYFGHMWELYAFWAFVPVMLRQFSISQEINLNVSLLSFLIIGLGGVACVVGGYLSEAFGTKKIAATALSLSGVCCLISPFMFDVTPQYVFIGFLIFWGLVVITDSPLFSSIVAREAAPNIKGTALTISNCIGFAITIVSIQLLIFLMEIVNPIYIFLLLAPGPIFGIVSLYKNK